MAAAGWLQGLCGPLLLLGPGVLLHRRLQPARPWVEAPLLAAAAWIVLFWWLRLLPAGWGGPVLLVAAASWVLALLPRATAAPDRASLALLALAAVLFGGAAGVTFVPPGVDAAMHAAVARLLGDASGRPAGFRPYWPLDAFHSYPVGQPTLTALIRLLGGAPWRAAALAGAALSYALALCGLAAAAARLHRLGARRRPAGAPLPGSGPVRERGPGLPASRAGGPALPQAAALAVGAGAVLIARAPLRWWTWGGAPNALALGLGALAFALGAEALDEEDPRAALRAAGLCGLLAAGALLTHAVPPVALAWCGAALGAAWALRRARAAADPQRPGPAGALRGPLLLAGAGALALLLCAPWLATLRPALGPSERDWIRRSAAEFTGGTVAGALRLLPRTLHDVPLLAAGACALWVGLRAPRRLLLPLGLAGALALLVLNGIGSWLPGSAALYPERVAALLVLPCALLACDALALLPAGDRRLRAALAVAALGLAVHAGLLRGKDLRDGRAQALAAPEDAALIARLDARLPPGCTVATNYGDAGQWIPALAGRPVSFAQVHVLWFDEVHGAVHPCAAFRGAVRPFQDDVVGPLCARPGACRELDREGAATAWEVTDPALEVELGRH